MYFWIYWGFVYISFCFSVIDFNSYFIHRCFLLTLFLVSQLIGNLDNVSYSVAYFYQIKINCALLMLLNIAIDNVFHNIWFIFLMFSPSVCEFFILNILFFHFINNRISDVQFYRLIIVLFTYGQFLIYLKVKNCKIFYY